MIFSTDFYRKLNWIAGLLLLGTVLGVTAFSSMVEIRDLDLWLHLRMGEFIVQNKFVPLVDVLSCSFDGKPWINHEWLFQVIAHLVQSAWGMDGLIYMQAILVMSAFSVLFLLTYQQGRELFIAPLLFAVMLVYQTRFTIRPDVFSLLFLVLYFYIMALHLDRRWSVAVLFILQVIWTNIHGYSFLGIVLVLIAILAEWIRRHGKLPWEWNETGRLSDQEYRRLFWALGAVILATFINPLGFAGTVYPLTVLGGDQRVFFENITELKPSLTWAALLDTARQMPYKTLIFLSAASFFFNRRRVDVSALMLWVLFLGFSLIALRNMAYFAFVAYLVCMLNISRLSIEDILPFRFKYPSFLYITGIGMSVFLIVCFLDYGREMADNKYYDFSSYDYKSRFFGIAQRNFPDRAADFIIEKKIRGNFFNDFNSGAYLIGRLYPQVRVFMDGRTELRGAEFFLNYKRIWDEGDEKLFDEAVEKYDLSGALVNTSTAPAPVKFLKMIFGKPDWKLVYFDYDALVFLRDRPENQDLIRDLAVDLERWTPIEPDLYRFGDISVFPYHYINRATTLYDLGFADQALLELDAALKIHPLNYPAFKMRAEIYRDRSDFKKAFENWRLAAMYDREDEVIFDFAQAYLDAGDAQGALRQARMVVEAYPKAAKGHLILARALAKNGQYEKGYDILLQALSLRSPDLKQVLLFGDICREGDRLDLAFKVYAAAVNKDVRLIEGYQKLAEVYELQGDRQATLMTLRRALRMDPHNLELKDRVEKMAINIEGGKE